MKSPSLMLIAAALAAACSTTPPAPTAQGPAAAPASPPAAAAPMPAPQEKPKVSELDDPNSILSKRSIYFPFDVFTVDSKYNELLQAHAGYLGRQPAARMTIQGNADERGSREYNLALGQKRAEAVKRLLKMGGAAEHQVEAISYGAERSKADCHEERCWQENRRDDLVYGVTRK